MNFEATVVLYEPLQSVAGCTMAKFCVSIVATTIIKSSNRKSSIKNKVVFLC